ncbi:cytochrome P450 4g15-like isoform X2 [Vespa mandarinia]|uniref:cytochrome P450 4g15-like isoform X2 n=1 Tax=Vespa mandarinia TaxID=7446 RepID=UPI001617C00D|nr:cytochrome P450 4g15-like isoform X2 [Vespa mandarinia]
MFVTFPDIQDKVYVEVNRIYCSDDPKYVPMTYSDIKSMKLLERVIKETLRLFPPGPVVARKVTQDIKGQHFAMLEMATVIATLIKRYRIKLDYPIGIAEIGLKMSLILKPAKPIGLKFESRN